MKNMQKGKSGISLNIDTSAPTGSAVKLYINETESIVTVKGPSSAQHVLGAIATLLQKEKLSPEDIQSISVHTGPGSYTGLRIGAAIAQALGLLLSVRVNSQAPGDAVHLIYS